MSQFMSQFSPFYGTVSHLEYDSGMIQAAVPYSITIEVTGLEITGPSFHFPPSYGQGMNPLTSSCNSGLFPIISYKFMHGSHLL